MMTEELEMFLAEDGHLAPIGFMTRAKQFCRTYRVCRNGKFVDEPIETVAQLCAAHIKEDIGIGQKTIRHMIHLIRKAQKTPPSALTAAPRADGKCQWCAQQHEGRCPLVTAIEYHESGAIKRVEFLTSTDNGE
jgi:hypothetical protein